MAQKVEAYRSENGRVFNTAKEAAVEDIMENLRDEQFENICGFTIGLVMDYYPKLEQYFKYAHDARKT